jgi:rubrerythrin
MKKNVVKKKEGMYSVEKLHHFRCVKCNKWWSIGDPKIAGWVTKRELFCPLCGHKQKMVKSK